MLDISVELYQPEDWDIHKLLFEYGIFPTIITCVAHSNYDIKMKSLRILINLLSLPVINISWAVIRAGVMNQVAPLIWCDDPELVKQSLWVISNVMAGPKGATKMVVPYDILPTVLKHLQSGSPEVANECLFVLLNLFEGGSPKLRTFLVKNKDVLDAIAFCLKVWYKFVISVCNSVDKWITSSQKSLCFSSNHILRRVIYHGIYYLYGVILLKLKILLSIFYKFVWM